MGWEVKNLQKTKETLKNDVEKLEKEIVTLESQKKSVIEKEKIELWCFYIMNFIRLKMQMQ